MADELKINGSVTDQATMVELRDVHKSFGDHEVLKGINVSIRRGEVVAIVGPSGGGKSTLLRCVNLLESVTAGQVLLEGQDLTAKGVDINHIRRRIGMVFQQFNLFPHLNVLQISPSRPASCSSGNGRRPRNGRMRCSPVSACRTTRPAIPSSCPAVNNNGWPLPER